MRNRNEEREVKGLKIIKVLLKKKNMLKSKERKKDPETTLVKDFGKQTLMNATYERKLE